MFNIRNIIVPTDFSKLSFTAFDYAKDIAVRWGAKIHLVYVLEKQPPFLAMRSLDVNEDQVMKSMEEQAQKQLEESVKYFGDVKVELTTVLRKGVDYEELVQYSKQINADLIVLATHGRTGFLHTLIGSVAEKVIRHAKCPVLVTTPTDEERLKNKD